MKESIKKRIEEVCRGEVPEGYCVFFTENATGSGPVKPIKHICPVKHVKRVKPMKHVKRVRRVKSVKKLSWSQLSSVVFFAQ